MSGMGLGPINRFLTKWIFRLSPLKSAYTPAEIRQFVAQTGFRDCDIRQDGVSMEIWLQK
ncbi:MAG TPA: hypothetical protein VER55_03800 [Ardenticatenaceae bacterium]|nr:hypothetical protein [Ardenticatenaceae bacterium]